VEWRNSSRAKRIPAGTNDATYCLCFTLQLRKEHQQDTYLLFIDLIKAFDTANHDILFAILENYGAPRALIDVIRRLHDNFQLKLVFDKKNQTIINYTVGVRQGDNMAGLLFLFLMQAMDESFKNNVHFPNRSKRGRLLKQPAPTKTKGVPFHFGKSMFADNAVYILSSRPELETLCAVIFHHMRRFGLLTPVLSMKMATIKRNQKWRQCSFLHVP
jgi:hypothetical protein